jgi:hypothetical protein
MLVLKRLKIGSDGIFMIAVREPRELAQRPQAAFAHQAPPVPTKNSNLANFGAIREVLPFALIVGYSLHGLWDLLHELQAHGAYSVFEPGQLTRFHSPTEFFVQPSTSVWRRISMRDAPSGLPRGSRCGVVAEGGDPRPLWTNGSGVNGSDRGWLVNMGRCENPPCG